MSKLEQLCTLIRDYEGKPGDRNYRNCNPGNARFYSGGYAKKYGLVKKDKDGFAIFKDYDTGFLYLTTLIKLRCKAHPTWTFIDLMRNYAPSTDGNNPDAYATWLAQKMGVDVHTFTLNDLLT